MRVLIVHEALAPGARTDELDALVQAGEFERALEARGHHVERLAVDLDLEAARAAIESRRPDLAVNLVEALGGSGRLLHLVPSLLERLGVPFTGGSSEALFATTSKTLAKRMLALAGLPTPQAFALDDAVDDASLAGEWIVKSVWEEGSVGLDEDSVVTVAGAAQLRAEIERRLEAIGGEGFAERYVDGREFNVSLLERGDEADPQVLPIAEIVFEGYGPEKRKVVGFRAKWDESSYEYGHTPRRFDFAAIDAGLLDRLAALSVECWRLFRLRGYARVDFRVDFRIDGGGAPFILEMNQNPCIAPDAGFIAAAARAGLDSAAVIDRIVAAAMRGARR